MQVELAYGQRNLVVNVPDNATVLWPKHVPGLPDEAAAIRQALRQPVGQAPLHERVRAIDRVAIVFSDITRPIPNNRVLPPLLAELDHIPREQIVLINGLGTHQAQTRDELVAMLGANIVNGYRIEQHNAWDDDNLIDLGRTRQGHRALVNRTYYEADFKILTGFIEPHIFAGFSGGPKAVLPGIAGIEAIMDNHGYAMLNAPTANWCITEGNPVWEEIREVGLLTRPDILLNVTLNRERKITAVFAGEMMQAHRQGTDFVRQTAMAPVDDPFDVVLTTNSGYPLDINLYQSVKGMSAAAQVVKQGGVIVIATECRAGVPDWGEYKNLVHEGGSADGILQLISRPGFRRHDQWEAQLQANLQKKASIHIYSEGLSDDVSRGMLLEPCHDIEATLSALLATYGPDARLCVLPEGSQSIPYLRTH
jgi:nickel-dependent lactate racemase